MIYRTRSQGFGCLILLLSALLSLPVVQAQAQCSFTVPPGPYCAGDACSSTPVQFTNTTTPSAPTDTYAWDFGDTNVETDTSSKQNPSFLYTRPGTYTVTLKVNGGTPCTQTVTIGGLNEFTLEPDINKGPQEEEICKEDLADGVVLTPKFEGTAPSNVTYRWSPGGEDTPTLTVDSAGCYSVQITDPVTGCSRTNKVTITSYKPDPNEPQPAKERGRWYFGQGAGIKFVGGQPQLSTDNQVTDAPEGVSVVSDLSGKPLFYTDGRDIYLPNSTTKMPNGDGLNGSPNVTQGVLIVAQPGCASCNSVYYVFTISETGDLFYTVVDMRLNGGKGEVVAGQKNIPIPGGVKTTERITAIKAEPDTTGAAKTWLITHDANTGTFRATPFTAQGLGIPVTSDVGAVHGPEAIKGQSYMKTSPDGKRVAVVIPGVAPATNNRLQLFDFEQETGKLSNPKNIDLGKVPPSAYGIEFSSDTTLYVSLTGDGTAANPSQLLQFSLRSEDTLTIANSQKVIATSPQKFGALQIDPDKQKVYLAIEGSGSVGVINQPNSTLSVDFQENGFNLGGATSQLGLPNISPTENPPGFGQGFTYDGPECAAKNEPVTYEFQAQPDRAPRNDGQPNSFYKWQFPDGSTSTVQNPTYVFPGPGSYLVKVNISNDCIPQGEDFDKTIIIKQAPDRFQIQPNAPNVRQGANISTCAPSVILDAGAQPNAVGSTYQWFFNSTPVPTGGTQQTLTVTQPGAYAVLVVNGTCARTDVVNVTFTSPKVALGRDTTLCGGGSLLLSAGNPGATYVWSPNGETTQTITVTPAPGSTTTYSVTVTDPVSGCQGTDAIVVRGGSPSPVPFTVQNANVTCTGIGTPNGSITLTPPAADGPFTFVWTGPTGFVPPTNPNTASLTGLNIGNYQIIATNAGGCQTIIQASVNPLVSTVNYAANSPALLTCSTNPTGTLVLTPQAGSTTATAFTWKNSDNQPVGTNSPTLTAAPGTYSVELTDAGGCKQFLSNLVIQAATSQPIAIATAVNTGCGLADLFSIGSSGGTFYRWEKITSNNLPAAPVLLGTNSSAQITNQLNPVEKYTLTVGADAAFTCASVDTVTVSFPKPAAALIGTPQQVACDGETITLSSSIPPAGVTYAYQWQKNFIDIPGATAPTLTVTSLENDGLLDQPVPYTIVVRAVEANCPPAKDTISVTFKSLPPPMTDTTLSICSGTLVTFRAPATSVGGLSYIWANRNRDDTLQRGSSPQFSVAPLASTVYTLTVANGTCTSTKNFIVNVTQLPTVDLPSTVPDYCANELFTLTPAVSPGVTSYEWTLNGSKLPTQTGPTLTSSQPGKYVLKVTTGQCFSSDSLTVNPPKQAPVPAIPRKRVEYCVGGDLSKVTEIDAGPGDLFTYEWYDLTAPTVQIGNTRTLTVGVGSYLVKFTNGAGCSTQDTIIVTDVCKPRLFVPEAFTPNNDGNNDSFEIKYPAFVKNLEVRIYNRWGEVVAVKKVATPQADSNGSLEVWDGTFKGQPSPVGSYVWVITYEGTYPDQPPAKLRGGVALIR